MLLKSYWSHTTKYTCRWGRGNVSSTEVTKPVMMQHFLRSVMWLTLHSGATQIQFLAFTETRGIAPALVKIHSSNREGIRGVLLSHFQNPDFWYNDVPLDARNKK